jgi:hypothetical protein
MLMLTRPLKKLDNMISCTPLDAPTLNSYNEMERILVRECDG